MTRDPSLDEVIKRDWHEINEQLVHRGEVAADLSWLGSWNDELKEMNAGKQGRPYRFPRSLVLFVRLLRDAWHLGLRQAEGLLRPLSSVAGFEVPDYTTLWHRLVRVLADGAYDTRDNFDFLRSQGIEAGIRTRKNVNMKMRGGTYARPLAVRERQRLGFDGWSRKNEYSMCWKVEVVFSAVKRMLGEALRSRRSRSSSSTTG